MKERYMMYTYKGPDHIFRVRKGLPQKWDERMNRHMLGREEGKYFRRRKQHAQAFPQSVHLSPHSPLPPWSNKPCSLPFVCQGLCITSSLCLEISPPRSLHGWQHFYSNPKYKRGSFRMAFPAHPIKEEPVSYSLFYQLQLILSIAVSNYHSLIFVLLCVCFLYLFSHLSPRM